MNQNQLPKPLAAAAGAGDLAVEKVRELSKMAADRLSAMESDPTAFADRVQGNIENRAESFGTAFRGAQTTVREQAKDMGQRAQGLLQAAVEQAEEAYENLAKRGETVVSRASEQRSLPDVPGLRMIKPAPADNHADGEQADDESYAKAPESGTAAAKSTGTGKTASTGKSTGSGKTASTGKTTGGTANTGKSAAKKSTAKTTSKSSRNGSQSPGDK